MSVSSDHFSVVWIFHAQQFSPVYPVCAERDDMVSFCVTHLHVVGFGSLGNGAYNSSYLAR